MSDAFPRPAPGFDDPLGVLAACHERIERHCTLLRRIVEHLRASGADADARAAAERVMRYFDRAGRDHHEDEEQDLFPALRESGDAELLQVLAELESQHARMDALWAALRARLESLDAQTQDPAFARVVEDFAALYARHLETENAQVLPRARRLLDAERLAGIGAAMARRRKAD